MPAKSQTEGWLIYFKCSYDFFKLDEENRDMID